MPEKFNYKKPREPRQELELLRRERKKMKELQLTAEEKEELKTLILESKELEDQCELEEAADKLKQVQKRMKEIRDKLEKEKGTDKLEIKNWKRETVLEFDMEKELQYWLDFYEQEGVDWVNLPKKIRLTKEDIEYLQQGALALCPDGNFEKLKLLIVPEGLADTEKKYEQLHQKMSKGYKESYQNDNFKEDGGFAGLKNKSDKLRLILVKDAQNLEDDELYKSTQGKSVDDLEAEDGIFKQLGLRGIDTATYLVWQRDYFKRKGKHLDEKGWTWLTEHERPVSGYLPRSGWGPGDGQLYFDAAVPYYSCDFMGCRLSSSREVA